MILAADIVSVTAGGCLAVLSVALCLCFTRLLIGPSVLDRVVALDLIATLLVGLLVLHGVMQPETVSLQVATVLALLNFLGTIAFATYVRRKSGQ